MTRRSQILFFLPALAIFGTVVLGPCVATLVDSFFQHALEGRMFIGASLYRHALVDADFHRALANNLVYMGWTFIFEVVGGLALALALQRERPLNHFLRIAMFSPAVLSMVVIGLLFGFFFKEGVGVLPGMLDERRAVFTISLVAGWAFCGLYMMIFLAGLASIPAEVLEAARLDGASAWQTFWRVKLPLLRDVLGAALVLCFTGAFNAFDLFWVMAPNQDHASILATLLVKEVIRFDNRGYGSVLAVLLTAIVLLTLGLIRATHGFAARRGGKSDVH